MKVSIEILLLFNDVIHEYQQVQSSHDNDEREDEIVSGDAMESDTNFVETRDSETPEEIICELPISAADKQNQTTTEHIMITARVRTPLVLLLKTK